MGCLKTTFRAGVIILNLIMLIIGIAVLILGFQIMKNDEEALHHVSPKSLIVVFATAGVTIFGSILGIASMISGSKCCLGIYLVFAWSSLLALSIVTVFLYLAHSPLQEKVDEFFLNQFNLYGLDANDTVVVNNKTISPDKDINSTLLIDTIQSNAKCCGYNNYTDWATLPYSKKNLTDIPLSCCKDTNCTGSIEELDLIYKKGCVAGLNSVFNQGFDALTWISFGLSIASLLAVIATIGWLCTKNSNPFDYTGLGDSGFTTA